LRQIKTLATSLGARYIAKSAFEWTKQHTVYAEVVTDRAAVEAAIRFADDHRILVEPACGASLSLIYHHLPLLKQFPSILVIVCGGSGVTQAMLSLWEDKTRAMMT
jgi:L-serine/L-threonine ammonia-lyase